MFDWDEDDGGDKTDIVIKLPPPVIESYPLQFHYNGLTQFDPTAACIYHYRVLEYFAFGSTLREISKLRHDHDLADSDFGRKIVEMVFRDEKGPLYALVANLADDSILEMAQTKGIIKSKDANLLGIALYSFRNSITHGKQSHGYDLAPAPVISPEPSSSLWREVLEKLSDKALISRGRKLG